MKSLIKSSIFGLFVSLLILNLGACRKEGLLKSSTIDFKTHSELHKVSKVPLRNVKRVAKTFRSITHGQPLNKYYDDYTICSTDSLVDSLGQSLMYLLEFCNDSGWVIVSGDYRMTPILAHNDSGGFSSDSFNMGLALWARTTLDLMNYLITEDSTLPGAQIEWVTMMSQWDDFENDLPPLTLPKQWDYDYDDPNDPSYNPCDVAQWDVHFQNGPLIGTNWGQGQTFNDDCPTCTGGSWINLYHAYTGCVATAVAQIMKYWGEPSADFTFSGMGNGAGSSHTQALMADIGNEVGMNYGCDESSASSGVAKNHLDVDYGYTAVKYVDLNLNTVVNELLFDKPVYADGCATRTTIVLGWNRFFGLTITYPDECHAWVLEGYKYKSKACDGNIHRSKMIYVNWGWDEYIPSSGVKRRTGGNGWYRFDLYSTTPSYTNYGYAQKMIYDIEQ